MFYILSTCNDYILGNIILIIRRTVELLSIIVPILLIIGASINIAKGIFNPEDKSVMKKVINQFISAIIVFLLPFIINTTMEIIMVANNEDTKIGVIEQNGKVETFSVARCWNYINTTDVSPKFNSVNDKTKQSIANEQKAEHNPGVFGDLLNNNSNTATDDKKKTNTVSVGSNVNSSKTYNKVVLIGDSRFVQQQVYASKNSKTEYIAKSSEGIQYLKNQINNIKAKDSKDTAFVINMGVNDYWRNGIVNDYVTYLNNMANTMKGKIYFLSVNPVDEAKEKATNQMYITTNANINKFNSEVKNGLNNKITYLDSNSYLKAHGFTTVDGIHYDANTSKKIYEFITANVKS